MWLKRQSGTRKPALELLGTLESELMERIWPLGEISVRELHVLLAPRFAYTTIMTTLDRLFKKGLLRRRKVKKAFLYSPCLEKHEYRQRIAEHLLGVALEQTASEKVLLSCFVNYVSQSDVRLLDELDELIESKRRDLRARR
jgi:predicted transcriptional regulator